MIDMKLWSRPVRVFTYNMRKKGRAEFFERSTYGEAVTFCRGYNKSATKSGSLIRATFKMGI